MAKPSYLEDVDVSNLESAIATLVSAMNELKGVMEEHTEELKKIKTGTGMNIGVNLDEGVQ